MLPTIATGNVASALAGEYEVANSLRFDDGSSDYLVRTPSSQGNLQISTFSYWLKRSSLGEQIVLTTGDPDTAGSLFQIYFDTGDRLHIETASPSLVTNRKFRDLSAWYHIVVAVDTTQGTDSNRIKIYVNGVQETSFLTEQYPTQNANLNFNKTVAHYIGVLLPPTYTAYYDGYMAEVVHIDGQQLAADQFGEFDSSTNIWKPIDVSGLTFGTNGFYLDFENSSSLGADVSGNGNNFTVNNLTSIDQSTDTCTNNFATLNPLKHNTTLSEGNLKCVTGTGTSQVATSTFAPNAGKWYWEVKADDSTALMVGVADVTASLANSDWQASGGYYYYNTGVTYHNNSGSSYGDSWSDGDTIGVALDLDNNKIYFSKNGTFQNSGDPTSGSTGTGSAFTLTGQYFPALSNGSTHNGATAQMNFGSPPYSISSGNSDGNGYGNFEYSVPSGYYALNTKNLAKYG